MKDEPHHNGKAHSSSSEKDRIKEYSSKIEIELKEYTYDQRVKWITDMKDRANSAFKEQDHEKALDLWMQALCGFNFKQKKYGKLS